MSTTFQTLIQNTLKRLSPGQENIVLTTSGAGGGGGTTLLDASLADDRSDADSARYVGNWIRIPIQTSPSITTENIREIASYTPATGALAPVLDFDYAVPASCVYEIHRLMPPSRLKECINDALRSMRRMVYTPFTQVTDGDMESSVTTSWTASNASHTKVTTAAYVRHGSQCSRVANTLANGYIASTAIPVIEQQVWLVFAYGRCASGTATLIPYDSTNSAAIESTAAYWSTNESAWFELGNSITIPSGCQSMTIRLKGTEASADIYWDSVIAINAYDCLLALPSWITDKNQAEGFFYFPQGPAIDDGGYTVNRYPREFLSDWSTQIDETAATPWQVEVPVPLKRPLYLKALRPYAELTLDTDTTVADMDKVVEGAVAFAKDRLGHKDADKEMQRWAFRRQATEPRPQVIQRSRWTTARGR